MRVALGADHAGVELKDRLGAALRAQGHEILDLGTHGPKPVDYPDFAERVSKAVMGKHVVRGLVVCGSGVGAAIAANKLPGIRAALCHDTYSARQCVEHDDANVLCLGARVIGEALAADVVRAFLEARYTGETRHARRVGKILAIERRYAKGKT